MIKYSTQIIIDFTGFYRQLIIISLDEDDDIIRGSDIVVEIDKSKFGKCKYNKKYHIEGVWIISDIERTIERKIFVSIIKDHTSETLLNVISKHV